MNAWEDGCLGEVMDRRTSECWKSREDLSVNFKAKNQLPTWISTISFHFSPLEFELLCFPNERKLKTGGIGNLRKKRFFGIYAKVGRKKIPSTDKVNDKIMASSKKLKLTRESDQEKRLKKKKTFLNGTMIKQSGTYIGPSHTKQGEVYSNSIC